VEVRNLGHFPFDFKFVVAGSPEDAAAQHAPDRPAQAPAGGGEAPGPEEAAGSAGASAKGRPPSAAAGVGAGGKDEAGDRHKAAAAAAAPPAVVPVLTDGPVSEFGRFVVEPTSGTVGAGRHRRGDGALPGGGRAGAPHVRPAGAVQL
jgi:hypothetical protein